jgi:hypothetical protein
MQSPIHHPYRTALPAATPPPDRSALARAIHWSVRNSERDRSEIRTNRAHGRGAQMSNGLGMSRRSIWAPMPTRLGTNPA